MNAPTLTHNERAGVLDALERAAELVKTARKYFPKSIHNPDTFALELTNSTITAAIRTLSTEP